MINLQKLKELANNATDGPWWVAPGFKTGSGYWCDYYIAYGEKGDDSQTYDLIDGYRVETDYEYIAYCNPQNILQLLEYIDELENSLAVYERKPIR